METKRIDEYHKHGCHFFGNLVTVDYATDMQKDKNWGNFGANVSIDYWLKAKALVREKYGDNFEELLAIPELVVRLKP